MAIQMRAFVGLLFCIVSASASWAQSVSDIQAYIARYERIALEQEREYGIPASITLAQGILESGAGQSSLTRNSNNHFGIKGGRGWNGPLYYAWDDEPQKSAFRCYDSAAESFRDHSLLLRNNSRYGGLFAESVYDYRSWAWGLQRAGYATAKNYAAALIGYIEAYRLYALNGGVKLRSGKTVTIVRRVTERQPESDDACLPDESEPSDEERNVTRILKRFVVEINELRCTVLYPGQTLAAISRKYDISKRKLLEYNEMNGNSDVREGDIVFLERKRPKYRGAQDDYRVRSGETLYDVSQLFGIRLESLMKMNGKTIFSPLKEGESLRLK